MYQQNQKYLHIITSLSSGGAENALKTLLIESEKNSKNLVVSLFGKGAMTGEFENLNCELKKLELNFTFSSMFRLINFLSYVRKFNPKIIHCWMYHACIFGSFLNFFINSKLIWSIRHGKPSFKYDKILTIIIIMFLALISYISPRKIIFCSKESMLDHHKFFFTKKNNSIIFNGFHKYNSIKYEKKWNINNLKCLKFIVVGRYHPSKDFEGSAIILNKICDKYKNLEVVYVGEKINLFSKKILNCIDLSNQKKFKFYDYTNNLKELYSSSHFLLSCSKIESFPNVIAEAMSHNVICFATKVGATENIIDNEKQLFHIGDYKIAEQKILSLLKNSPKKLANISQEGKKRIFKCFSIDKFVRAHGELYQSIQNFK